MHIERECKIRVADQDALKARMKACNAQSLGRVYERNWVLDTEKHELHARQMLLRLRSADNEKGGILTVKRPALNSRFKTREEIEIHVDSISGAKTLLAALGYEPRWYYEKYREYWRYKGCVIALDELPEIGNFIEVEGPADHAIRLVLEDLELDPEDHIDLNYLGLFEQFCQSKGEPLRDMRFQATT